MTKGVGRVGVEEDGAERLVCHEQAEFSKMRGRGRVGRRHLCSERHFSGLWLWLYVVSFTPF